jgi:alpha-beta hydrolase superfamily lysophospholipase
MLASLAVSLTVALGVAVVAVWLFQNRLIFLPAAPPYPDAFGAERVDYRTPEGQPLLGFLVLPPAPPAGQRSPPRGAIVHFHGNADLAVAWVDWAREASRRSGLPVFLAEYRGYAGLPGTPGYAAVMRDARATVALVRQRFAVPDGGLVLYGHSLGSGVASDLAADGPVRALMLESPMTSILDMGRQTLVPPITWFLPLINRAPWAPAKRVAALAAPVWVAHGTRDQVMPFWMGQAVFTAAREKGEMLAVKGAGHNDVSAVAGDAYWAWFDRAMRATLPAR